MSEPAVFVLIRAGQKRFYFDRWASAFLFRELLWGPDELERWLTDDQEIDDWTDEVCGGAVVDFDNQSLVWLAGDGMLEIPRVELVYERLLQAAWPGFQLGFASRGVADLAAAAGLSDVDEYEQVLQYDRTAPQAAIEYSGDDQVSTEEFDEEFDEEYGDEHDFPYDEDATRVWITLIDRTGAVRHRNIPEISQDLIGGLESAIANLARMPEAEIPPESVVTEGMWIDEAKREIGYWGGRRTRATFPELQAAWQGWTVRLAEDGYAEQCAVSGPLGMPMTDTEALGQFLPTVLSTKRFDIQTVFGVMGGQLKRTAIKGTGCLLMVLLVPVMLMGAISGNWQAALVTVAIITLLVVVTFKVIEGNFKKNFASSELIRSRSSGSDTDRPPVAGPTDATERRERLDQLLASAGFPSLREIEPHFSDEPLLDDLL